MKGLYIAIAVFSALAIYFTYDEYRNGKQIKKTLIIVSVLEGLVVCTALLGLFFSN